MINVLWLATYSCAQDSLFLRVTFGVTWFIMGLLYIPYFVWGVYLLRKHLDEGIDIRITVQVITLVIVIVFLATQYVSLRYWLADAPIKRVFAIGALLLSGGILYGHLVTSLASYLLADMVLPSGDTVIHEPNYGAAEARERVADYEGAVREYYAVSAMFPKDPVAWIRAGDNLIKLDRPDEAAECFEKGFRRMASPERSLSVAYRLADMYQRQLGLAQEARRVLETYLERFPDAERVQAVRARLDRLLTEQSSTSTPEEKVTDYRQEHNTGA